MSRRRGSLFGVALAAAVVGMGVAAFACTALATVTMSSTTGIAGERVTMNGAGFGAGTPVEVFFNRAVGAPLWSGAAGDQGGFVASFAVPRVAPGYYPVLARATNNSGDPARTVFQVMGVPVEPAPTVAAPADPVPAPAPALAVEPAPTPPPVASPAAAPTPAVSSQPAPARVAAPAADRGVPTPVAQAIPAPSASPVQSPAPIVSPTPAAAPEPPLASRAPEANPARVPVQPAKRSVVMSAGSTSSQTPWLALGLVGAGFLLSLGATALVVSGRRSRRSPARTAR